jgi:hypothetical protein
MSSLIIDGTPCEVKVSCTVWAGGKSGDNIKRLPIGIPAGSNNGMQAYKNDDGFYYKNA